MNPSSFNALSPLDGRYAQKLHDLQEICSEQGLMSFRLLVEVEWLIFLAKEKSLEGFPKISKNDITALRDFYTSFTQEKMQQLKKIEATTNHDVKAVEYLLKEFCTASKSLAPLTEWVHFGCTSEDINNTAYALMLKATREKILLPLLEALQQACDLRKTQHAKDPMLSRTHGQAASPTTLGKEFAILSYRLQRQITQLDNQEILGKWNGAVGNFNAHTVAYPEVKWLALSEDFIHHLNLQWNPLTTQIESHDYMAEFFHTLIRINTILINFARDMWGYISLDYFTQTLKKDEVGSSTMPHKINPIDFENAEGNLGIANSLLNHCAEKLPISRFQRDLSDSTVLRNIGVLMGHCVLAYTALLQGLSKITLNTKRLLEDLNQHWEVLTEAVQTVMRRYGLPKPYEQLKQLSRGQAITQETLQAFIQGLDLPEKVKQHLCSLTPQSYIGLAAELAVLKTNV